VAIIWIRCNFLLFLIFQKRCNHFRRRWFSFQILISLFDVI